MRFDMKSDGLRATGAVGLRARPAGTHSVLLSGATVLRNAPEVPGSEGTE